jgi:hypothetical protein
MCVSIPLLCPAVVSIDHKSEICTEYYTKLLKAFRNHQEKKLYCRLSGGSFSLCICVTLHVGTLIY